MATTAALLPCNDGRNGSLRVAVPSRGAAARTPAYTRGARHTKNLILFSVLLKIPIPDATAHDWLMATPHQWAVPVLSVVY